MSTVSPNLHVSMDIVYSYTYKGYIFPKYTKQDKTSTKTLCYFYKKNKIVIASDFYFVAEKACDSKMFLVAFR